MAERPGLCGVRLERGGPVRYVDANGLDLAPLQLVLVEFERRESLAMVAFGPNQLVANEAGVGTEGRVVRLATENDVRRFGVGSPTQNSTLAESLPPTWSEWLVEAGAEPSVQLALDNGAPSVAEFIQRLFPASESAD
jgi:hypothetical protein